MPKFLIKRTYKHTEEIEVEASDEYEAQELAQNMEFEQNHDDWLYSEDVKEL